MGKLKRISKRMISSNNKVVDLFIVVFNHLIALHREQEKIALSWIWNDPTVLQQFAEVVLGLKNAHRDSLRNGYHNCQSNEYVVFPQTTWEKIDEIFLEKRLLTDLPRPIRDLLKVLKSATQTELLALLQTREEQLASDSRYSHTWIEFTRISEEVLASMRGCFLGDWVIHPSKIFQPELAEVYRVFPPACIFAECHGNLTHFYERKGTDVRIIVVHLKGALEPAAMAYMRTLLVELFAGHPKILRQSMATLESHMTGFGPCWQRHELDGGSKVSFYTHAEKLSKILKNLPSSKAFELLAERYAHTHLSKLILALYMWKLLMLVRSFFNFSKPYLGKDDYDMSDLESSLGGYGPCAYHLYITKDFCSQIHRDRDTSKITLSYCSNPDAASTTPVQFAMAQHGFRFGVENGSLFAFDSGVAHGTPYRTHTHNASYMACLVVNSALHALTQRRQLL